MYHTLKKNKPKMADGDVKKTHDSNTLETNENASNDAEEADEVTMFYFSHLRRCI